MTERSAEWLAGYEAGRADGEHYDKEAWKARQDEVTYLQQTIGDAISALGIGTCPTPDCDGCKADAESAREILRSTGLKPSGYENFDADARRAWDQALALTGGET